MKISGRYLLTLWLTLLTFKLEQASGMYIIAMDNNNIAIGIKLWFIANYSYCSSHLAIAWKLHSVTCSVATYSDSLSIYFYPIIPH